MREHRDQQGKRLLVREPLSSVQKIEARLGTYEDVSLVKQIG